MAVPPYQASEHERELGLVGQAALEAGGLAAQRKERAADGGAVLVVVVGHVAVRGFDVTQETVVGGGVTLDQNSFM